MHSSGLDSCKMLYTCCLCEFHVEKQKCIPKWNIYLCRVKVNARNLMWLCAIFFFDPHNTYVNQAFKRKFLSKNKHVTAALAFLLVYLKKMDMAVAQRNTIKSWPIQGNRWVMVAYGLELMVFIESPPWSKVKRHIAPLDFVHIELL